MSLLDFDNPINVTREIYWVGFYDECANLHCNPYLLITDNEGILFDPGSIPHFPIVMRKVIDTINPKDISTIVTCHQDPDCCGNLAVVEDVIERDDLKIVTSKKCSRLIAHYGLNSELYIVEENDMKLELSGNRFFRFISLPFLHSPGAIATYDEESKSLFSGDLFGAISDNWALFKTKDYLEAMAEFHREYVPSREILSRGLEQLKNYSIDRILPQHG